MRLFDKLLLLTCLYFSQGVPFGFFSQALPALMRERGASLPQIGLTSLLVLPWALKFLWAPLLDKYGYTRWGHRKTWILSLQLLGILLLLVLGALGQADQFGFLVWGFFVANLIAATQDIASDGLAVNILGPEEKGIGNGLQYAGYRLGMVVGGGVILMLFSRLQWQGSFIAMALGLLLATIPIWRYAEPAGERVSEKTAASSLLLDLLREPGFLGWTLIVGFYKFGDAMINQMLKPFLVDHGMDLAAIGKLLGTAGFISALAGALLGGYLVRFIGRYRALLWFGLLQALVVFAYYLLGKGQPDIATLYLICSVEHLIGGMATAALFTIMMDVCRPAAAGTDYTLQASAVVITTSLAGVVGGFVAAHWGYSGNFLAASVLALAGTLLFAFFYRGHAAEKGAFSLGTEPV